MSGLTNGVSPGPSVSVGEVGKLKSELSTHPSEWRKRTSWEKYGDSVYAGWYGFGTADR